MHQLVELVDRIDYGKLAARTLAARLVSPPALAGERCSAACGRVRRRAWPLLPSATRGRSGRGRSIRPGRGECPTRCWVAEDSHRSDHHLVGLSPRLLVDAFSHISSVLAGPADKLALGLGGYVIRRAQLHLRRAAQQQGSCGAECQQPSRAFNKGENPSDERQIFSFSLLHQLAGKGAYSI